jgi:hypothetical protein
VWHEQNAYCWLVSTLKRKLLRLLFPVLLTFALAEAITGENGTAMKLCCGIIMERNVRMIHSKLHAALMDGCEKTRKHQSTFPLFDKKIASGRSPQRVEREARQ